jgi:hypothetical protein
MDPGSLQTDPAAAVDGDEVLTPPARLKEYRARAHARSQLERRGRSGSNRSRGITSSRKPRDEKSA